MPRLSLERAESGRHLGRSVHLLAAIVIEQEVEHAVVGDLLAIGGDPLGIPHQPYW
jgi:hypothetical protein